MKHKKLLISFGSVAAVAMPVVAVVSCTTTDGVYEGVANLTNAKAGTIHALFRGAGSVKAGDQIELDVNKKPYFITWTAEDAAKEQTLNDPAALFEYIADRFVAENPSLTKAEVITAFGSEISGPAHHGAGVSADGSVNMNGVIVNLTGQGGNKTLFHALFRSQSYNDEKNLVSNYGNAVAGTVFSLNVEDRMVYYTWTAQDVAIENTLGVEDLMNYIIDRLAISNSISRNDIAAAIGYTLTPTPTSHHFVSDSQITTPTNIDKDIDNGIIGKNYDDAVIVNLVPTSGASATFWHDLFRYQGSSSAMPASETVDRTTHQVTSITYKTVFTIQINNINYYYGWTSTDVQAENNLNQDELFDYISEKFSTEGILADGSHPSNMPSADEFRTAMKVDAQTYHFRDTTV